MQEIRKCIYSSHAKCQSMYNSDRSWKQCTRGEQIYQNNSYRSFRDPSSRIREKHSISYNKYFSEEARDRDSNKLRRGRCQWALRPCYS